MIIGKQNQFDYLLHRIGKKQILSMPRIQTKALEGNREAPDFLNSYGNSNISVYVGFIDLAGFSTKVKKKTPEQIRDFLNPFLTKTIDILYDRGALIDKMIGDEIMFLLPEIEENNNLDAILSLGQILGHLYDLAYELKLNYRYRIGLSYGIVNVYHLEGKGYNEWSIVGEPIHVAKRLHTIDELSLPNPVCGAIGLSLNQNSIDFVMEKIKSTISLIAGFASRYEHQIVNIPICLKGVGKVVYANFFPKSKNQ